MSRKRKESLLAPIESLAKLYLNSYSLAQCFAFRMKLHSRDVYDLTTRLARIGPHAQFGRQCFFFFLNVHTLAHMKHTISVFYS